MYTVPPAKTDLDPDFWYWYRITMKRLGWGLIVIHLVLFFVAYLPLLSKAGGGFMPDRIVAAYFSIASIAIVITGVAVMRISLAAIQTIFQRFTLDVNAISYPIISAVVVLLVFLPIFFNLDNLDLEFKTLGLYLPMLLYFGSIVVFPIFKFNLPRRRR